MKVNRRDLFKNAAFVSGAALLGASPGASVAVWIMREIRSMKTYGKILFSILAAGICTSAFATEPTPQSCKKSGKNCPMNDNKACNCGKKCSC